MTIEIRPAHGGWYNDLDDDIDTRANTPQVPTVDLNAFDADMAANGYEAAMANVNEQARPTRSRLRFNNPDQFNPGQAQAVLLNAPWGRDAAIPSRLIYEDGTNTPVTVGWLLRRSDTAPARDGRDGSPAQRDAVYRLISPAGDNLAQLLKYGADLAVRVGDHGNALVAYWD